MKSILFALVSVSLLCTSAIAFAEMPCMGASTDCAWICTTNSSGAITGYTFYCGTSEDPAITPGISCFTPSSGEWTPGPCGDMAPPPTPIASQADFEEAIYMYGSGEAPYCK